MCLAVNWQLSPIDGSRQYMDTAQQILDTAEGLIQKRGFFGFSFQDIAEEIGIKKASIYYHFPAKAELGRAVIDRYRQRMRETTDAIEQDGGIDHWQALTLYLEPILTLGRIPDQACLCGVLGGEYLGLPEEMQEEISGFFSEHHRFLAGLLEKGREAGAFQFGGSAGGCAKLLFGAIEGGLLIKRTTGDTAYLDDIVNSAAIMLGRDV